MNVAVRALQTFARVEWLRVGLRERLTRWLGRLVVDPRDEFEIESFGRRYRGRLDNLVDWRVFFFGAHEKRLLHFLESLADRESVFVDVGANVGQHSLFLSSRFERVVAFEPVPELAVIARRRLDDNGVTNVVIVEKGLGSERASLPFSPPEPGNLGTGSFAGAGGTGDLRLDVVPGDEALAELSGRVSVIKIDVEGFEGEVLRGLRSVIESHRPVVILEYSDGTHRDIGGASGFRDVLPDGYGTFELRCDRPLLWLFNRGRCEARPIDEPEPTCILLLRPLERAPQRRAEAR